MKIIIGISIASSFRKSEGNGRAICTKLGVNFARSVSLPLLHLSYAGLSDGRHMKTPPTHDENKIYASKLTYGTRQTRILKTEKQKSEKPVFWMTLC
jgi:hypothetical protein